MGKWMQLQDETWITDVTVYIRELHGIQLYGPPTRDLVQDNQYIPGPVTQNGLRMF